MAKNKRPEDAVVALVELEEKLAILNNSHLPELRSAAQKVEWAAADVRKRVQALKDLIQDIERGKYTLQPHIYYRSMDLGVGDLDKQLALLKKGELPCPRCSRSLSASEDFGEIEASLENDGEAILKCIHCLADIVMEKPAPADDDLLF